MIFEVIVILGVRNSFHGAALSYLILLFLFSAYLVVLYSWVLVYLKLRLIYEKWKNRCKIVLIGVNIVLYCLEVGFGIAGNMLAGSLTFVAATSFLNSVYLIASITSYRISKNSISQKDKLRKMTKMANGTCILTFMEVICFASFTESYLYLPDSTALELIFQISQMMVVILTLYLLYGLRCFATSSKPPMSPSVTFSGTSPNPQTPRSIILGSVSNKIESSSSESALCHV
eukprot:Phypoly_transcript_11946.p1 GENE.Phypoly_transcript_11946~~Phypoly_transcript_11946.p1  ORF type:complete len:231 (+),score=13.54 Phypoly_transcript_11946:361-1053(+)